MQHPHLFVLLEQLLPSHQYSSQSPVSTGSPTQTFQQLLLLQDHRIGMLEGTSWDHLVLPSAFASFPSLWKYQTHISKTHWSASQNFYLYLCICLFFFFFKHSFQLTDVHQEVGRRAWLFKSTNATVSLTGPSVTWNRQTRFKSDIG